MRHATIYITLITLLGLSSCLEDPDCNTLSSTTAIVKFYKESDGKADQIRVSSIKAEGFEDESIAKSDLFSSVELPIRTDQNSSTFLFVTEHGESNITFTYDVSTRFISDECGIEYIIRNLEIASTTMDSVVVVNNTLSNSSTEDVKIFN
ncbi:DUF6452 family protein [Fulvivirga sediminis]|uniref:Uncharacterized protein n=1 Tax=Fulvivirga sediminis TaxID=2803949 RepID=A0A937F635_9BACT|nr:DUF6452 family protein [Fulvivirga sediminis]MBL3657066.1 hypothetical protein [Fulvivirga sediminis]